MRPRLQWLALAGVVGALVAGFTTLYRLRLARGDFFPPYSSLRSDPLGTRVLHDSLALLPEKNVTRWLLPLDQLPPLPERTIILAGLPPGEWDHFTEDEFAALDAAVRGGSRLVIALQSVRTTETKEKKTHESDAARVRKDDKKNQEEKAPAPPKARDGGKTPEEETEDQPKFVDLAKLWEATKDQRSSFGPARRGTLAPAGLPSEVRWESDIFFQAGLGSPWRVMYHRASRPVVVERRRGLGSIVLASDAYFLSNEGLQRDRAASLLLWVVGANARVEFVESHLGVVDDPGVAALARRYGLGGAFFTLLGLTILFVWRRMALFVPPEEAPAGAVLEYHPTAGLEALLRRAVPPGELVKVCAAEWRTTARAPDIARVDAALAAAPRAVSPVAIYNTLVRALQRRGKFQP